MLTADCMSKTVKGLVTQTAVSQLLESTIIVTLKIYQDLILLYSTSNPISRFVRSNLVSGLFNEFPIRYSPDAIMKSI